LAIKSLIALCDSNADGDGDVVVDDDDDVSDDFCPPLDAMGCSIDGQDRRPSSSNPTAAPFPSVSR
jgi:hypothetical protein